MTNSSDTRKISDQVAERLESMILTGDIRPGERLPAERKLAVDLDVSRPSLREGIQKLTSKGLLFTRRGGGTFVAQPDKDLVTPLLSLFEENPGYSFDVLEIRHALDPNAAWHAARRATPEDKEKIIRCFDEMLRMHGCGDPIIETRADAQFHLSIVEASHNFILLHVMRTLFELLVNSISLSLDKLYSRPGAYDELCEQHRVLKDAVLAGDAPAARDAALAHLQYVEKSLKEIDDEVAQRERSIKALKLLAEKA